MVSWRNLDSTGTLSEQGNLVSPKTMYASRTGDAVCENVPTDHGSYASAGDLIRKSAEVIVYVFHSALLVGRALLLVGSARKNNLAMSSGLGSLIGVDARLCKNVN